MNVLEVEQVIVPLLPLYFVVRYLVKVRPRHRSIESWWLVGSNTVFALLLLVGAFSVFFGMTWSGRTGVREVLFAVTIALFVAQNVWLEYRLRAEPKQPGPDGPPGQVPARADKTLWEDPR